MSSDIIHLNQSQTLPAVVSQQQPQSVCEGLQNLLNTTLPAAVNCAVISCVRVECLSSQELLKVSTSPCDNASLEVLVRAQDGTLLLNETLHSTEQPRELNYTTSPGGETQTLTAFVQVVSANGSMYYIVSLDSSNGVQLPTTAIPVNCSGKIVHFLYHTLPRHLQLPAQIAHWCSGT